MVAIVAIGFIVLCITWALILIGVWRVVRLELWEAAHPVPRDSADLFCRVCGHTTPYSDERGPIHRECLGGSDE